MPSVATVNVIYYVLELVNGKIVRGRLAAYDGECLDVRGASGEPLLVFRQAIATLREEPSGGQPFPNVPSRYDHLGERRPGG